MSCLLPITCPIICVSSTLNKARSCDTTAPRYLLRSISREGSARQYYDEEGHSLRLFFGGELRCSVLTYRILRELTSRTITMLERSPGGEETSLNVLRCWLWYVSPVQSLRCAEIVTGIEPKILMRFTNDVSATLAFWPLSSFASLSASAFELRL